ncbi:hypothetical protein D6821_02185 [Candidatus Parcubacteria bacterium]|nr:MAG: hypothetical protein D6821_02185 [Candidatus Parcubacteria bacterium]
MHIPPPIELSVAQIETLLQIHFQQIVNLSEQVSNILMGEESNLPPGYYAPKNLAIFADFLARRLKQNNDVSLFSADDIPAELESILKSPLWLDRPIQLDPFYPLIKSLVRTGHNPYEEYWRWLREIQKIAAENGGVELAEVLTKFPLRAELIRRLFTKTEFFNLMLTNLHPWGGTDPEEYIVEGFFARWGSPPEDPEEKEIWKKAREEWTEVLRESYLYRLIVKVNSVLTDFINRELIAKIY